MQKFFREKYLSLQTKLLLPLVISIVTVVAILFPLTSRAINRNLEQEADRRLTEVANAVGALINNSEALARNNAILLARQPDVIKAFTDLNSSITDLNITRETLGLQELSLYSANFQPGDQAYYYSGPTITRRLQVSEDTNLIREELILSALQNRRAESSVTIAAQNSQILGVAPVYSTDGKTLQGVVIAAFYMDQAYIDNLSQIINTDLAIVKDNAIIVSTIDPASGYESIVSHGWLQPTTTSTTNILYSTNQQFRLLGQELTIANHSQGYVLVAQPVEQLRSVSARIGTLLIAISLIFSGIALGVWLLSSLTFIRPLKQLTEATTNMRQGNLNQKIKLSFWLLRDEITTLTENFNAMAQSLNESYTSLEEKVEERTRELARAAVTDELTKAYNRRYFYETANFEFASAIQTLQPISIILFDGDNFKSINDTHGHLVGDAVLRRISDVAHKTIRHQDIFARYGGEEFIILLPETSQIEAGYIAERIRRAIAESHIAEAPQLTTTVSLGVATMEGAYTKLDELLDRADQALYKAKRAGKNQVQFG